MKHRTEMERESLNAEARPEVLERLESALTNWVAGTSSVDVWSMPFLNPAEMRWLNEHGFAVISTGDGKMRIGSCVTHVPEPTLVRNPPLDGMVLVSAPVRKPFLDGVILVSAAGAAVGITAVVLATIQMLRSM